MQLTFSGDIFEWRGPAPYRFVAVPPDEAEALADASQFVTYGWGMIPVHGRIGGTDFTTSLWPREGGYVVPVKLAVQRAEQLDLGDLVEVTLTLDL